MAYRDDRAAAMERVAALEREVAQAGAQYSARLQELLSQLAEARSVLESQRRTSGRRGAYAVGILMLIGGIVVLAMLAARAPSTMTPFPAQTTKLPQFAPDYDRPHARSAHLDDCDDCGPPTPPCEDRDGLPCTLDKATIVGGMKRIADKVNACYKQFSVPGLANVQTRISNSGTVSGAWVTGAFAGTPTGNCVEAAVRTATFPRFTSVSQTITYPFMLR